MITLTPLPDIPMVRPGDDLARLMIGACENNALAPADGDIVVVAQKIVSKAEGRYVDLAKIVKAIQSAPAGSVVQGLHLKTDKNLTPLRAFILTSDSSADGMVERFVVIIE